MTTLRASEDLMEIAPRELAELRRENEKLRKINASLMQRVERSMDHQANAYSMFQTAIGLEGQVRLRTEELKSAMDRLERLNEQLTGARDKAEQADRFKTRFFTAVGHDLLQPVHAARLAISAAGHLQDDPEKIEALLTQIDHALSSIEELLRTILDLSRLEAGAIRPNIQPVPVRQLLRSLVMDLAPLADEKGLGLSFRAPDILVSTDPLMLKRMVQNLLSNAVQYTDEGRILVAARRRGKAVAVEVWDTGPGIPSDEASRIFEEFQRGKAGERAGGGFGVGLAIIARMADALGHSIDLSTRIGRGTRFTITLPYGGAGEALADAEETTQLGPTSNGLVGAKALVVENSPVVLNAMRALLTDWQVDGRFATCVDQAMSECGADGAFQPDIILADYHLSCDETGVMAVEQVRDLCGRAIPAVIISADQSERLDEVAEEAGCEVLRKPVRPDDLRILVEHLLARA